MATADPLLADSLLMAAPKLPQPELIRCMMARPKRGRQAAGAGQDAFPCRDGEEKKRKDDIHLVKP